MGLSKQLERLDGQRSVANEFRVRTAHGACFSLITVFVIAYLVYFELAFNIMETTVVERVHVNSTTLDGLEIDFDITLPHVPCGLLKIDANDPTGQPQALHQIKGHRIHKSRIDESGKHIGYHAPKKDTMESLVTLALQAERKLKVPEVSTYEYDVSSSESSDEDYCGSCYGAGEGDECCQTCDDVLRAYKTKGWSQPKLETIEQCVAEPDADDEKGEGCKVRGKVALSTGGGNLHFSPGRNNAESEFQGDIMQFLTLLNQSFETFNVSHTITRASFGKEFPGHVHQLDGVEKNIEDMHGMYQYYFQVVPTRYKYLDGTTVQTNQFSVTEHLRHIPAGSNRGLPGIYFFYEVSALHVEIVEQRRGWIKFCTSLCAIVGGVITVMGMLDQAVYSTSAGNKGGGLAY